MKRMIYQVCLGEQAKSELYKTCIESVKNYCLKYDIVHILQTKPILKIKPDPFMSNRSEASWQKHGGFLPIYEKENAFDLLGDYDQIAIVDADIYIREDSPNIFEDIDPEVAMGAVCEREMPITEEYARKIINYSQMQYAPLAKKANFKQNRLGFEFFNMGMMVINCDVFKPYLNGQSAKDFLNRYAFIDFINGIGAWKWSTDQTLLNYFVKKKKVPMQHMDWKWNGLYLANTKIEECHFVHFFLKDKLPSRGEDVKKLLEDI